LLSKDRATSSDVIFQDGDYIRVYGVSEANATTTDIAGSQTKRKIGRFGSRHVHFRCWATSGDVSSSCVGFADLENIDAAVEMLLLRGVGLKMPLGVIIPPRLLRT